MKQLFQHTDTFRKSLRFRLIVASVVVEVAMLALMIGNNLRQAGLHLSDMTQARVEEMAESFSIALGPSLAARDHASLRSMVDRLVALPDVEYLVVTSTSGQVLVSAGNPEAASAADIRHATSTVEMYGQAYGSLRWGLSLAALAQAKRELLVQGLVIAVAEVALTIAALSSIAYLLTSKLENLTRASVRFAAGDYDTVVRIKGNDEVAALSAAFNTMSSAVREQFQRLENNAVVLRRSNAELTRLAEITAHHLQEPLRRLVSYSQLLRLRLGDDLPPESEEFLGYIVDGATRMKRMMVDLQAYAAIDIDPLAAGQRVDLDRCANEALASLRWRVSECGGTVDIQPLPTVIGNASQLTAALVHLLDNALSHRSRDVRPHVTVSAMRSGGSELIRVADNGPGIAPEYQTQVFRLFERLDSSSSGTGIGLAMVKKIVESHGGHAWIEPVAPHGVAINFALPTLGEDPGV